MTRHGKARQGLAWVVSKCGTPVPLVAFREGYERGLAGQGMARHGRAWVVSKCGLGPAGGLQRGLRAGLGRAGHGPAWQGLYRSAGLVPLVAFREGYERGWAGRGLAWRGRAWQGLYRSTNLIKDK